MRRPPFNYGAVASLSLFNWRRSMACPSGIICLWSGTIGNIPMGWKLCDGANGTPDLRGMFIKGSAAGVDPGVTGGGPYTPEGTNSAPAFTGTQASLTHSGAAVADHSSHTHTYTDVPNHTHPVNVTDPGHVHAISTGTTDGSVGRVDSASSAQAATFNTNSATTGITATTSNPSGGVATGTTAGPSATLTHSVTQPNDHTYTPQGTVAAPVFSGAEAVVEPAYYALAFIQKV